MEQEGALVLVSAGPVTAAATPKRAVAPPTSLAPGFRFHPTDEELVRYYLRRKACGKPFRFQAVSEIDVYKSEPWELAEYSSLKTRDLEWYFFSPVDRKYGNGSRLNRATGKGYWKATGKDRPVRHKSQTNGMKKTLVFHSGRAPDGKRTNWVMHEYRLTDEELERAGVVQDAFVLCRIFQKSGLGPPNGDRYAPFIEEEWDDDTALLVPGEEAEDDVANGDEARVEGNDLDQDVLAKAPRQSENLLEPRTLSFVCKRERSEEPEPPLSLAQSKRSKHDDPSSSLSLAYSKQSMHDDPSSSLSLAQSKKSTHDDPSSSLSLAHSKRSTHDDPSSSLSLAHSKRSTHDDPSSSLSLAHSKRSMHDDPSSSLSLAQSKRSNHDDPSSSHANGSEDSTTSQQDPPTKMMTTNYSPTLLAFPLLEPLEPKESQPSNTLTFDSSNLEKSVPPGYLKFISNLENEILNVSMERETAKIEVMRAQAMINILQSRIDLLNKENEDLRRHVRGG